VQVQPQRIRLDLRSGTSVSSCLIPPLTTICHVTVNTSDLIICTLDYHAVLISVCGISTMLLFRLPHHQTEWCNLQSLKKKL